MISNVIFGFGAPYQHQIDTKFSRLVCVTIAYMSVKFGVNHFKHSNVIPFYVISNLTKKIRQQTSFPVLGPVLTKYWHQIYQARPRRPGGYLCQVCRELL